MKEVVIRMVGDVAEVLVYDMIGGGGFFEEGITAKAFRQQLKGVKSKVINLRINSPGGSVTEAAAMLSALDDHPARIEVDVDGLAASAASVLAMAGDTVRMSASALMMVHDPYSGVMGGAADMRRMADLLDSVREQIIDRYAKKTGAKTSRDRLAEMMRDETWFTPAEAVAAGFADSITPGRQIAACVSAETLERMGYKRVPKDRLAVPDWTETERRKLIAAAL